MIDPFSLASGIAGLASLAFELSKITADFIFTTRDAPKDAFKLSSKFERLATVPQDVLVF
jgi:hypothetical protein